MMLPIRFRPSARREFLEAVDWYDNNEDGVGQRFADAVDAKLKSIRSQPELYPAILGEVREATLRRFPYTVSFLADPDEVVVISVFHHRRDPSVWQSRVGQ